MPDNDTIVQILLGVAALEFGAMRIKDAYLRIRRNERIALILEGLFGVFIGISLLVWTFASADKAIPYFAIACVLGLVWGAFQVIVGVDWIRKQSWKHGRKTDDTQVE